MCLAQLKVTLLCRQVIPQLLPKLAERVVSYILSEQFPLNRQAEPEGTPRPIKQMPAPHAHTFGTGGNFFGGAISVFVAGTGKQKDELSKMVQLPHVHLGRTDRCLAALDSTIQCAAQLHVVQV